MVWLWPFDFRGCAAVHDVFAKLLRKNSQNLIDYGEALVVVLKLGFAEVVNPKITVVFSVSAIFGRLHVPEKDVMETSLSYHQIKCFLRQLH